MITKHYYTVDGSIYYNKIEALYASTKSGKTVQWHWHDEYNRIDWTKDPAWSLNDIYCRRAQQLRDKYDWLILSFSGGSDSWTVLNSFIKNNIHLDEIFFRWPIKATNNLYIPNPHDKSPSNHLSEWNLTVQPEIERIRKNYPNIKITIYDCTDDIIQTQYGDNLIDQTRDHMGPGWWAKFNAMGDNERRMIDLGKKTALILGVDKPQMCVKNQKVYCYFLDILINTNQTLLEQGRNTEFFYWSPEMPEVTLCQSREIYRYLLAYPSLSNLIDWDVPYSVDRKHIWDQVVRSIIYPEYDLTQFQSKKDSTSIDVKTETWLQSVADPLMFDRWKWMVDNVIKSIDPKYLRYHNEICNGFNVFIGPMHYLGDLPPVDQ